MKYILSDREPKLVLKYFEDISAIPRGSYNEAAVSRFVADRAAELGLWSRVDARKNVFVKKPATKGFEDKPAVMLQAHLDIVCEKNADTVHDFEKDGLKLELNGDILTAKGTTLGADDGKGVAYMLALMDSDGDKFPHPPLEFLFTTGEEVGFWGALDFDCSDVESKRMIGLDAGPEGNVAVTSSGSRNITWEIPQEKEPAKGDILCVSVKGLKGGHSAQCITWERGNANKFMGRILHAVRKVADIRICESVGGLMFNAIPRENVTVIAALNNSELARKAIEEVAAELKNEYRATEDSMEITCVPAVADTMNSAKATENLINVLYAVPNGVKTMNTLIPGLPVTSTNMGVVKTSEDKFTVNTMLRSHLRSSCEDYIETMLTIARLGGADTYSISDWIPAWEFNPESDMRSTAEKLYREKTGKELEKTYVHGGLELGVFCENIPGIDIVTLGCDAGDVHTVTEWMDIESFRRVYEFIMEYLAVLAEK